MTFRLYYMLQSIKFSYFLLFVSYFYSKTLNHTVTCLTMQSIFDRSELLEMAGFFHSEYWLL